MVVVVVVVVVEGGSSNMVACQKNIGYSKSGNFHCRNNFVVDSHYEN